MTFASGLKNLGVLRAGRVFQQVADDQIDGDAFRFGVEGGDETVTERREREGLDILHGHVGAAFEQGTDFGSKHDLLTGPWSGTPADHLFDVVAGALFVRAGGADEIEDKIDNMIRHGDLACELLGGMQVFGGQDGFDGGGLGAGGAIDDLALRIAGGVVDLDQDRSFCASGSG